MHEHRLIERMVKLLQSELARAPGLKWKIYAFDDEASMGTGIYLFHDEEAMRAHMENLRKMEKVVEHVSELEMKVWDVQEALCKITGAPI